MTAASHAELVELLSRFESNSNYPAIQTGRAKAHSPRVAFVFAGEQLHNGTFGRELYERAPAFREAVERCDQLLRSAFEEPLISVLYPESEDRRRQSADELPVGYRGAANFTLQYALAELWRACGIEPYAVLGYGAGEYVAACIAGVFSLEDGLRLAVACDHENPAEFAERAHRITYNPPRILFLSNRVSGNDQVNSAEYWLRRSEVLAPAVLSALAKENCAGNLYFGEGTAFQNFVNIDGKDLPGKWQASTSSSDCGEFLTVAGSLYVLGCELDASGFYRDATAAAISLPTYPFERERYWLEPENGGRAEHRTGGARFQSSASHAALNSDTGHAAERDEWIYDLVWEPKPLLRATPQQSGVGFDANLIDRMSVRDADGDLIYYSGLNGRLEPVCTAYIANAFKKMGADSLAEPKSYDKRTVAAVQHRWPAPAFVRATARCSRRRSPRRTNRQWFPLRSPGCWIGRVASGSSWTGSASGCLPALPDGDECAGAMWRESRISTAGRH